MPPLNMSSPKQSQIQNLQIIFLIEGASLTGYCEAFHSSLAQSVGELWLRVLGKILAPKFWLSQESKG